GNDCPLPPASASLRRQGPSPLASGSGGQSHGGRDLPPLASGSRGQSHGGRDLPPSPPAQGGQGLISCGPSGRAPSPPSAVLPRSTAVPRGRSPVYVRVPCLYGRI